MKSGGLKKAISSKVDGSVWVCDKAGAMKPTTNNAAALSATFLRRMKESASVGIVAGERYFMVIAVRGRGADADIPFGAIAAICTAVSPGRKSGSSLRQRSRRRVSELIPGVNALVARRVIVRPAATSMIVVQPHLGHGAGRLAIDAIGALAQKTAGGQPLAVFALA